MPSRQNKVDGNLTVPGTLTVLGGINSKDVSRSITELASTKEAISKIEGKIAEMSDPIVRTLRSSAPVLVVKADGTVAPTSVIFSAMEIQGQAVSPYTCYFKLYKDDVLYHETTTPSTALMWTPDVVQEVNPGPETYPGLNLYPTFSNKVIRCEIWTALSGGSKIDSIDIAVQPSWQGYIQNELATMYPKYRGRYEAAHPASYENGDSWIVYDTDDSPIQRGFYLAVNYTPQRITGASEMALKAKLTEALTDVAWAEANGYGVAADYGIEALFQSLGVVTAFVQKLFAQAIEVLTGGSIFSGYSADGNTPPESGAGFWLGANGRLKAKDGDFSGILSCRQFIAAGLSPGSNVLKAITAELATGTGVGGVAYRSFQICAEGAVRLTFEAKQAGTLGAAGKIELYVVTYAGVASLIRTITPTSSYVVYTEDLAITEGSTIRIKLLNNITPTVGNRNVYIKNASIGVADLPGFLSWLGSSGDTASPGTNPR